MKEKIITGLFLVTIFGFSIATFVTKDREFSEMENRMLQQTPEFTMKRLVSGDYGDDLEKYLSDQIVIKDSLVIAKNEWDGLTGKSRIGNVYYTNTKRYIQEHKNDDELLGDNVEEIAQWFKSSAIGKKYFLLAPTAAEIYGDELPNGNLNESCEETYQRIKTSLSGVAQLVYPKDILMENKASSIYYKTDHHWTMSGAKLAYDRLAAAMGITPCAMSDFKEIKPNETFYGSLYSQAPLLGVEGDDVTFYDYNNLKYTVSYPDMGTEYSSFIFEDNLKIKDKYTALFNGNVGRIVIENKSMANGPTLIVFKDSYANSIVPYLVGNYKRIVMVDLRFFNGNVKMLVDEVKADAALFIYNTDFVNTDNNFWKLSY